MNLLGRLIRFVARMVFVWLFRLLTVILRLLLRFLILPIVLFILRSIRRLIAMFISATVNGPSQFIDKLAKQWTLRLRNRGIANEDLDFAYRLCRFLAFVAVLTGWVVTVLFTVAILRVVFGYLI